jgi:hypothetical protein
MDTQKTDQYSDHTDSSGVRQEQLPPTTAPGNAAPDPEVEKPLDVLPDIKPKVQPTPGNASRTILLVATVIVVAVILLSIYMIVNNGL